MKNYKLYHIRKYLDRQTGKEWDDEPILIRGEYRTFLSAELDKKAIEHIFDGRIIVVED